MLFGKVSKAGLPRFTLRCVRAASTQLYSLAIPGV